MKRLLRYRSLLFIILVSMSSFACQNIHSKDERSPYFRPLPGSILILNQDIEIPPDSASTYLQFGQIVREKDIQVREPNCKFEVRDVLPASQTIHSDRFEIKRIQLHTDFVAYSRIISASAISEDTGSPLAEIYATTYYLHSANQPQVLFMTCQHWEIPGDGNHLSIAEIRQTLGELMTLKLRNQSDI